MLFDFHSTYPYDFLTFLHQIQGVSATQVRGLLNGDAESYKEGPRVSYYEDM